MTYTESLNLDFVNVLGSGYVMDHCISAFQKEQEEKAFRIYLSDAVMAIADNTAKFAGGSKMSSRFYDIINIKKEAKKEETADEIILKIKEKVNGCI